MAKAPRFPRVRVTGSANPVELDKRFYVPGIVIESDRPECGATARRDLGQQYLSYPTSGTPATVYFGRPREHEWEAAVIVRVSVEPAALAKAGGK